MGRFTKVGRGKLLIRLVCCGLPLGTTAFQSLDFDPLKYPPSLKTGYATKGENALFLPLLMPFSILHRSLPVPMLCSVLHSRLCPFQCLVASYIAVHRLCSNRFCY